jgi:hypothetical protein
LPAPNFDPRLAGTLHLDRQSHGVLSVTFSPSALAFERAGRRPLAHGEALPQREVIRFDAARGQIELTPLIIYPDAGRFLQPRFDKIRTLVFEGYDVWLPDDADEVATALDVLPSGFYRHAEFGLGLPKVLLPIVKQIERLPKVDRLVVSKLRPAAVQGSTVILTHDDVESATAALQRLSDRHQRRSLQERNAYARNHLISPLDPVAFPEEVPPYTPDSLFETLAVVREARLRLSDADKTALVSEVRKGVRTLKQEAPESLFRLHRQIELVNLDVLIERFKALLAHPHEVETRWQKLFDLNPFILSMVFGYPVVKVLREATVGLSRLDGRGAKIADFLAKNPNTANAALVELKTPQTELLAAKPYRGSAVDAPVYVPHAKLTGAVVQVLDQRYRLQKDIATHLSNNRGLDLSTYHVDCVVVIGMLPKDPERQKGFEIYRQGLKDVRIVTFDELETKLETLRAFLAALPAAEGEDELAEEEEDVDGPLGRRAMGSEDDDDNDCDFDLEDATDEDFADEEDEHADNGAGARRGRLREL